MVNYSQVFTAREGCDNTEISSDPRSPAFANDSRATRLELPVLRLFWTSVDADSARNAACQVPTADVLFFSLDERAQARRRRCLFLFFLSFRFVLQLGLSHGKLKHLLFYSLLWRRWCVFFRLLLFPSRLILFIGYGWIINYY